MRAAGAEIRRADRDVLRLGQRALRVLQPRHARREIFVGDVFQQAVADAIATSFGSSAPLTGNSQLPCSSFLPMQIGWLAVP